MNRGTIAPSTRQVFFKIMYNKFILSPKKILFEQYYRLHILGPTIAVSEIKSNNVFVLTHKSFDQNSSFFLHGVQEAVDAFIAVLRDFCFKSWLPMTRSNIILSQILQPIFTSSNLACCSSFVMFSQSSPIFLKLLVAASSSSPIIFHLQILLVTVSSSSSQTSLSSLHLLLAGHST